MSLPLTRSQGGKPPLNSYIELADYLPDRYVDTSTGSIYQRTGTLGVATNIDPSVPRYLTSDGLRPYGLTPVGRPVAITPHGTYSIDTSLNLNFYSAVEPFVPTLVCNLGTASGGLVTQAVCMAVYDGLIYVASATPTVYVFATSGAYVSSTVTLSGANPSKGIFFYKGRVYACDSVADVVRVLDAQTFALITSFSIAAEKTNPENLVIVDDIIYVAGDSMVHSYSLAGVYTGLSFALAGTNTLATDGTYLWRQTNTVPFTLRRLLTTGVDHLPSFSVNAQETNPTSVTIKGSTVFVVGSAVDTVFEYTKAGVYTGFSFSAAAQTTGPFGLTYDGTFFYVSSTIAVYQYDAAGVYTGFSFFTNPQDTSGRGLSYKDGMLYIAGTNTDAVYEYDLSGTYTGFSFSVAAQTTFPVGVAAVDDGFIVSGGGKLHRYGFDGVFTDYSWGPPINIFVGTPPFVDLHYDPSDGAVYVAVSTTIDNVSVFRYGVGDKALAVGINKTATIFKTIG